MVECPCCYAPIDEEEFDLDEGYAIVCARCGISLVISRLSPLEFESVEEWFDDFDQVETDEDGQWRIASL